MPNQYVNKVVRGDGSTIIDLSNDTVTSSDHIMQGYVGHLADGSQVTGTGQGGGTGAISVVDTTDSHGGTVRTITALDISDTTAVASDVAQGKYFYAADGTKTAGTASGGSTPSATQHSIYFEFSDDTNTTITAYYDSTFISDAITATTPTTYGGKTVTLAQLDGVAWYEPANIPLNTQLIDYTAAKANIVVNENTGQEESSDGSFCSDFTAIDPSMVFSFVGYRWYNMVFYDSSKNYVGSLWMNDIATSYTNDYANGTISSTHIPSTAAYVRINSYPNYNISASTVSLIRTA